MAYCCENVYEWAQLPPTTPHHQQQHHHTSSINTTTKTQCSWHVKVQKPVEIAHVPFLNSVVDFPAMKRQQGPSTLRVCRTAHSTPRCTNMDDKWYTQYAACQDKWPSDSFPMCKALTSVREPVETESSLSQLSLFLQIVTLHKSRHAVISHHSLSRGFPEPTALNTQPDFR